MPPWQDCHTFAVLAKGVYERASILLSTNLPFRPGHRSPRLGALLDRLTHHVHILEMNGESYRLKHSRESAASQAPDDHDEE